MSQNDCQLLLLPLLESLGDREVHSVDYIQAELNQYVDYSDEKLSVFKGENNYPVLREAISTATGHLAKAGLVEILADDQLRITSLGKMILNKKLNSLDHEFLRRMPGYNE